MAIFAELAPGLAGIALGGSVLIYVWIEKRRRARFLARKNDAAPAE